MGDVKRVIQCVQAYHVAGVYQTHLNYPSCEFWVNFYDVYECEIIARKNP